MANAAPVPTSTSSGQPRLARSLIPATQAVMPRPFHHPWQAPLPRTRAGPGAAAPPSWLCRSPMPFPAQLPAIHACQSTKGCVLQGVVGSTVLVTAAATSPLPQAGGTTRNSGLYRWVAPRWVSPGALQPLKLWPCSPKDWELEEEQSAGGISIPYLPPGKRPGTERQGRQSWQLASMGKQR